MSYCVTVATGVCEWQRSIIIIMWQMLVENYSVKNSDKVSRIPASCLAGAVKFVASEGGL